MLHENLSINKEGHLCFAGMDCVDLAKKYGTPLYLIDNDTVYNNCVLYDKMCKKYFGNDSYPLYASKALSFTDIYKTVARAGIGIDVVSGGELYTAKNAGFPMDKVYFHGNNKTQAEIEMAIEFGIDSFVADNYEEICNIDEAAEKAGVVQKILLRLSPGIDPHTHKAVVTGSVDSKFGVAIETGQALELVKEILKKKNIRLAGFHAHIGSQIFDCQPFVDAAEIMLDFVSEVKKETGFVTEELNLGGGFGVRYVESHPTLDYETVFSQIAKAFNEKCEALSIKKPAVRFEPGRSTVAAAGMTLYTVGSLKTITGYKSYVAIDGGMPDNPRYALYGSEYSAIVANKAEQKNEIVATIAGRCCESGDLIQENVPLPRCEKGDILAILVTGAYNYSMASNYNRLPRPAIVSIDGGKDRLTVKRESYADLVSNDL